MKLLLIASLVACAAADVSHIVAGGEDKARIVKQVLDMGPNGSYQWAFETENGISVKASGTLEDVKSDIPNQISQGAAQWTAPGGELISLQYVADQNGYQPQGSHLPTPPPIPELIIKSLEYIRAHPPKTEP